MKDSSYHLHAPIPDDSLIRADKFMFCQPYVFTRKISTGGFHFTLKWLTETGVRLHYQFDSNAMGMAAFPLANYLCAYTLLRDRLPSGFPESTFFSKNNLMDILPYYYQTIECEGGYYKEFIHKNTGRTTKENNLRTG
ncbi:hypothetical protein QNI19_16695 [Cytophagaceae bacterium DM2B3-1]|uniref:Uncharacterized protein n=1 Tax=Xanthocytophaga flava TaxID=3048013 RepID=A0ABT7CM11_9BACT|nr:hypothetical protein [Xanthocytophaga flavus]MDJ1494586.1 hypothetical protein [Xanthocytophaga flavus]